MSDWTITARPFTAVPNAVRVTVTGPEGSKFEVKRNEAGRMLPVYFPVDVIPADADADTVGEVVHADPLAPFIPFRYTLFSGGVAVAETGLVVVADPGRPIVFDLSKPTAVWTFADALVDETGLEHATSTTAHPVIGSKFPVVVGDVRRARAGVFVFGCKSIEDTDELLATFRDGVPYLLRVCPSAHSLTRDTVFCAMDVREERYGRSGARLVTVDYQTVDWPDFVPYLPEIEDWTYQRLIDRAADYGVVMGSRKTYLDLLLDPLAVP